MEVALQLAPATVAGILYALRAHHLAGTSRAVPGWRRACFLGGLCLIVVAFTSMGSLADELFWAHMVEHLVIGDLGTLLLVLGLTGPVLAPVLRIAFFDRLRVLAHPLVAFPLWALNLYLWHIPYFHEGAVHHDAVHALQHFGSSRAASTCGWRCSARCPSRRGSATSPSSSTSSPCASRGRSWATSSSSAGSVFFGVYAAGERAHGHLAGRRPERGRRDHDDRGLDPHARACSAGSSRGRRARARSARSCSSWRPRAASSSPRRAPRGRSPPAAEPSCAGA